MPFSNTTNNITGAYHKQHQDGYLVEPRDAGSFSALADAPEYSKVTAEPRHESIITAISKQASDDYQEDIMKHMRQMEDLTQPSDVLIDTQPEIQWFMRPYLVDFLIEAHQFFQLLPETLFLTTNLLDRYCSMRVVFKRHYQLVGCASLLVATKYGERKGRVPMIKELKDMCCSLYDEQMFLQMELHVLTTLKWDIGHPTVNSFIHITLTESNDEVEVEHMAQFICEIALYHRDFVSIKPSIMARASIALAKTILHCHETLDLDQVEDWTARALSRHLHGISQILSGKYSSPHLSCSSIRLEHILAQQAADGKGTVDPLPEILQEPSHEVVDGNGTLRKIHDCAANDYPTPQITPDGNISMG